MLSTSLTRSRHSGVGRSIASATTVSSEEHFHGMGWPLEQFDQCWQNVDYQGKWQEKSNVMINVCG